VLGYPSSHPLIVLLLHYPPIVFPSFRFPFLHATFSLAFSPPPITFPSYIFLSFISPPLPCSRSIPLPCLCGMLERSVHRPLPSSPHDSLPILHLPLVHLPSPPFSYYPSLHASFPNLFSSHSFSHPPSPLLLALFID
jgi:hypothetical protein